jgi:RND family efflux transporter MFP subunit
LYKFSIILNDNIKKGLIELTNKLKNKILLVIIPKKDLSMKKLVVKVVISLVFSLILVNCSKPNTITAATEWDKSQVEEEIAVFTLNAGFGLLKEEIKASGVVAGVREAFIVSEAQGLIKEINFNIGDRVVKDQPLVIVDNRIQKLSYNQAKDQLDSALLELESVEKLSLAGRSSPADLTRAKSNASLAKTSYENALKNLEDTIIKSPITGIIASKDSSVIEGVNLTKGFRIARVIDTSSFRVTVGVGEREVGLISSNQVAEVIIPSALYNEVIIGKVTGIGAGSDPATGSYPVIISFENTMGDKIKSGMSANISIAVKEEVKTIIVPNISVIKKGDIFGVFVEENSRAQFREVSLGRTFGIKTEILDGLKENERIVISALSRISTGSPVISTVKGDSANWE